MTRIVVVRHGQTHWNVEARIQGHGDSALTDEGIAQAEAIAARLADEPCDVLSRATWAAPTRPRSASRRATASRSSSIHAFANGPSAWARA